MDLCVKLKNAIKEYKKTKFVRVYLVLENLISIVVFNIHYIKSEKKLGISLAVSNKSISGLLNPHKEKIYNYLAAYQIIKQKANCDDFTNIKIYHVS